MDNIPYGYCHCGCGQKTRLAEKTRSNIGMRKGDPYRYLKHHAPNAMDPDTAYRIEDRGYETPCWIWRRAIRSDGYGTIYRNGRHVGAHRFFYERHHGPLPPGMVPDHLCSQPPCVRPNHLEAVTQAENNRRGRHVVLTPERVRLIRRVHEETGIGTARLSKAFGVSRGTIRQVVRHETWRNL